MSESASHLAREAKGLHQSLKELLKTHNPWDREVEFSRRNLRRQYLRLLLVEPYAKESKDVETHLWMQTSYQFISHYKQSLTALDRTLQSSPRHQQRQGGHGPVEYRKLMQRFRQFLAEEEKFWTQFVARYQRSFALREAHPVLVALNILTPSDDVNIPNLPESGDPDGASGQKQGRSHFSFPPEDATPSPNPAEHDSRLAILSKAIVCLGDIARYRELYNEAGGRPKAGHEDGTAPARRGGRQRRGGIPGFDSIPRARNYDKAIQCYEQARLLVPYEGNPSHQLAILAFYQNDMFSSLFHYYRALCVRQPYDTASENVKKILSRALDQHAKKDMEAAPTVPESGDIPPRLRVEYFKEKVVLLHALWRLGSDRVQVDPVAHADDVAKDFKSLVSERILPIETVSRVIVLSEGALCKNRMIRDSSPPSNRRSDRTPDSTIVESQIVTHVIAMHRTLLEIGADELTVPPEDAAENDLAQRITATFRRTLPALRIASKWLVANIKYVLHAAQSHSEEKLGAAGRGTRGILIEDMGLFWAKYALFYSALNCTFPPPRLPHLTNPLDEDIDLKGFLPLRDLMVGGSSSITNNGNGVDDKQSGTLPHGREKVHPNEEQLMRIWDLLKDVKGLAELETCPIRLDGNTFSVDSVASVVSSRQIRDYSPPIADGIIARLAGNGTRDHINEFEDDAMTDTGRTDNTDPVGDAFRKALDDHESLEDDEDGEVILYNPRALGSPPAPAPVVLPTTPVPPSSGQFEEPSTVTKPPSVATAPFSQAPKSPIIVSATTAQDLLDNVMGHKRGTADVLHPPRPATSSVVQPQFPFGLGPNAPPSIWSTSLDQGSSTTLNSSTMALQSDVNVGQTFPSPRLQHSWAPRFESTQQSVRQLAVHPSPHFQHSHSLSTVGSGHHRSLSMASTASQHPQQPSFRPTPTLSGPADVNVTRLAEHRPTQWQSLNSAPFLDPAIVSSAALSQPTAHHGNSISYQDFPGGHTQQYVPPGQHNRSPSMSRIWGSNG